MGTPTSTRSTMKKELRNNCDCIANYAQNWQANVSSDYLEEIDGEYSPDSLANKAIRRLVLAATDKAFQDMARIARNYADLQAAEETITGAKQNGLFIN